MINPVVVEVQIPKAAGYASLKGRWSILQPKEHSIVKVKLKKT